jgi:DNA-binding beta-propeller fold protein YncE
MNLRRVRSLLVLTGALLLAVGGFAAPASAQGKLFVSNYGTNTVSVYPRNADGSVPPLMTITDGLSGPNQIAISRSARELFVTNSVNNYSVTVYDCDTGILKRTLAGPSTGLYRSAGIALDEVNGEMYVTNDWPANAIYVFDIGASGNTAPKRTIQGSSTGLSAPVGIVVDLTYDEILVVNYDASASGYGTNPTVRTFERLASGDVAPKRTIEGPMTGFTLPLNLTLDPVRDEIIVANSYFNTPNTGAVLSFPAAGFGNISPTRRLYGDNTRLCNPVGLALDTLNNQIVVANSKLGGGACDESIATFVWPSTIENQVPIRINVVSNGTPGQTIPISVAILDAEAPDTTGPIVNVPAPILAEATSPAGAAVSFVVSATDLGGTAGPVTCTRASGSTFALGTTTVTCSATDDHGNPGSASFTVTVRDTIAPVVTPPASQSVPQTSAAGAVITYPAPGVVENGSSLLSSSCAPASGSTFPVGSTTVTCTARDKAGNVGTATFTILVTAATAPDGLMYGIGDIDDARTHQHFVFRVAQLNNRDYGRLEFWANSPSTCPRADHDYDYDRTRSGSRDVDYGRNHLAPSVRFEATSISATFSDDPSFRPDRTTRPMVDTVRMTGSGKWNGKTGYTFEAVATDKGEPGPQHDTFSLIVKDSRGRVVANVSDSLDGGNIQSTRLTF